MKNLVASLFCLIIAGNIHAQNGYFQQKVNHDIKARLNDSTHILTAKQEVTYFNHSPDELEKIFFHLWPNAYQDNQTAFAKQQLRLNKTDFYFAETDQRGGYRSVEFSIGGEALKTENFEGHDDVVIVYLPEELSPGDSVTIQTDFVLRIPETFSRLGRGDGSYQLTQWYPKPAVYDRDGWHPMPYLDQGEFYNEFGNYEVTITLPEKYVVAATGTLQTQSELNSLKKKANRLRNLKDVAELKALSKDTVQKSYPEGMKTLEYTAREVHDFALFADMDYEVQYEKIALHKGDSIEAWTFFTPQQAALWLESIDYVKRAVSFYSEELGTYPYPQVTAVQGPLKAGSGMEYPMITVIGQAGDARALDNVITHEIGHNWWYGILASNERRFPWLDEGLNSSYEERYMNKYYPQASARLMDLTENRLTNEGRWVWEMQARKHQDQAPSTPSDEFTEINYFLGAYWKPAQSINHFANYVGKDSFRHAMQDFYEEYKFRHYGPEDLTGHLNKYFTQDNSWLFQGLIDSDDEVNYKISSVEKKGRNWKVKIRNTGKVNAPVSLGGYRSDSSFVEQYVDGFEGEKVLNMKAQDDLEAILINVSALLPEHSIGDNFKRIKKGKIRTKPVKLGFLAGLDNPYKRDIFMTPALGYNAYDGFQIGLWTHNVSIPGKAFEFSLLPNLGIASDQFAGMANLRYRWFFNNSPGELSHITAGLDFKNYSYNEDERYGFTDRYLKLAPYMEVHFETEPLSYFDHHLQLRSVFIEQEFHLGEDVSQGLFSTHYQNYWVHQLAYHFSYDHPIRPLEAKAQLESISNAWRYTLHLDQEYQYQKGSFVRFSLFAGGVSNIESSPADIRLYGTGQNGFGRFQKDYTFDRIMLGRSEREGILAQQIFDRDAFLKTRANNIFSSTFLVGLGMRADLPIPVVKIVPYIDVAIFKNDISNQTETAFSSGLALSIFRETLEVYFPVWESSNIRNSVIYENNPGFFNRVTFSLNLEQWGVFKIKEQLNLY